MSGPPAPPGAPGGPGPAGPVAVVPAQVQLALLSHTNAGKTTLARTLLGRDVGEVRDAPHVTDLAEAHELLRSPAGDRLMLWDTPGFGDPVRLAARLRRASHPIGWFLAQVWDRHRNRPLWCSQQAVRAARDAADVVLYLVNAAEDPRDAGYLAPEFEILRWIGRPVVVLLNQTGPPQPAAREREEQQRWHAALAPLGAGGAVLALDAFARCWVQEGVLLEAVAQVLPPPQRAALQRLQAAWAEAGRARFAAAMHGLALQLAQAARDRAELPASGGAQRLAQAVGIGREAAARARTAAMEALARRLDAATRASTAELVALHGLEGGAAGHVLERLETHYRATAPVDETRAALLGGVVSGALSGLAADLAAGGLSFGAGLLTGGLLGGLAGAGVARGFNRIEGRGAPALRWSADFLDGLARAAVLRYLAVAHFGRGRGGYVEGETPPFWPAQVDAALGPRRAALQAAWRAAAAEDAGAAAIGPLGRALRAVLAQVAAEVLERLYPGCVPAGLAEAAERLPAPGSSGGPAVAPAAGPPVAAPRDAQGVAAPAAGDDPS